MAEAARRLYAVVVAVLVIGATGAVPAFATDEVQLPDVGGQGLQQVPDVGGELAREDEVVLPSEDPGAPASNPGGGAGQPSTPPGGGTIGIVDAVDDAARTTPSTIVRIDHAVNDRGDIGAPTIIAQPVSGTATPGDMAGRHIIYAPHPSATDGTTDTFVYQVCSVSVPDDCDTATVTVSIQSARMHPRQTDDGTSAEQEEARPGPTAPEVCQEPLQWGGHDNGRIPPAALRTIGEPHRLKADAAQAFLALRGAARQEGVDIGLTDSYRSFEAQVRVRQAKGHLVATAAPGTSVHGWGKALDLRITPQVKAWLERNSRRFAWINPPWAKRAGKSFEPWHYEFYGTGAIDGDPQCAGIGAALTSATNGASEAASEVVGPSLPGTLASAVGGRTVGLALGAVASLVVAAAIIVGDVRRGRSSGGAL